MAAAAVVAIPLSGGGGLGSLPHSIERTKSKKPTQKLRFVTQDKEDTEEEEKRKENQTTAAKDGEGISCGCDDDLVQNEDEDNPGKDALKRQARRLYAALTYSSDNEREAYRRNKTEQTRLNMVLDHIGIQRSVRSKALSKDIDVMKVRSSKFEEKLKVAAMGSRAWTASSQRTQGGRSLTALSQLYRKDDHGEGGRMLEFPEIGRGQRHNISSLTAPGSRNRNNQIAFISESVDGDWEHRRLEESRRRTVIVPVVAGGSVRGNASRYADPTTPNTPQRSSSNKAGQASGLPSRSRSTKVQFKPSALNQVGPSLEKSPYRESQSQKQPLMAILATSLSVGKRWKARAADAKMSLDADIESVLNMRAENGGARSARRPGAPSGFGLRRPANFDITNYRSEEEFIDDQEEESLGSMTSSSARPNIDRLATPSSNAFRGEANMASRSVGGFSSSAACISLGGDLQIRRRCVDTPQSRQHALQSALLREKSTMKYYEDKIDVFYKKLKGNKREVGKRGPIKANHWDMRGEDEKLLSY